MSLGQRFFANKVLENILSLDKTDDSSHHKIKHIQYIEYFNRAEISFDALSHNLLSLVRGKLKSHSFHAIYTL